MDRIARLVDRWVRSIVAQTPVVIYAGVFLPKMTKQRLLRAVPPDHSTVWAHHMTTWHFRDGGDVPELPWGVTVPLKIVGVFSNTQAQAVVVDAPRKLKPPTRTPHVTVSTAPGVSPAASNALVPAPGSVTPVAGLPALQGVVGWVDAREVVHFDEPPTDE